MIHWEWLTVAVLGEFVIGWMVFALCGMSSRNELEEESFQWVFEWLRLLKRYRDLEAFVNEKNPDLMTEYLVRDKKGVEQDATRNQNVPV